MRTSIARVLIAASLVTVTVSARAQPEFAGTGATVAAAVQDTDARIGPPATLTYANRPIVDLRAWLLGRPPAERVIAARTAIDRLVDTGVTGPVTTSPIGNLITVTVGGRLVFAILPTDIDALAGETLTGTAALAAAHLQTALHEVDELRRPRRLLAAMLETLLATAVFLAIVWVLRKAKRAAGLRLVTMAVRRLEASAVGNKEFVRSSRILESLQQIVRLMAWSIGLLLTYAWLAFGLRRFPFTRPWGESLGARLTGPLSQGATAVLHALPALITVLLIALLTRFTTRTMQLFFQAVEDGRITVPWMYPETAQPTRRLFTAALWLFAVALAYPYLPGSESDAFKGVSLFVGLILSLGSSGLVNQMMSGLTLTYSRSLQTGDVVAVGEVRGVVTLMGALSAKITTAQGEEVTIPNAVVVSQVVTNYSRLANTRGVFVPTDLTIGYDVPWRQVHALLLMAAARTPGIRLDPAPLVRQAALEDAYVKYTLLFCLERPTDRLQTLTEVHANILDAFNEYGVQIMSPRYEADPEVPKVVPRDRWSPSPSSPASAHRMP